MNLKAERSSSFSDFAKKVERDRQKTKAVSFNDFAKKVEKDRKSSQDKWNETFEKLRENTRRMKKKEIKCSNSDSI